MYLETGLSSFSLPCSTNCNIANAVNDFVNEPIGTTGPFSILELSLKNFLMQKTILAILPSVDEIAKISSVEENVESVSNNAIEVQEVLKYRKSGLTAERSLSFVKIVVDFMEKERPYVDPELTLFLLAERMEIHPNHLSQVINHHFKQNFFDFINEHRVRDVKKAIAEGTYTKFTLLGIGMEFGFSSKASFNRAFKKSTGMTPTLYKKLSEAGV